MSPVVILNWVNDLAYAPRGTRYEIRPEGESFVCWLWSPSNPYGLRLGTAPTRARAMELAQRHLEQLTADIGAEQDARNHPSAA